ncbi:hypothetical protein T484DRAFT_1817205 [Baffinella frigidus]|nr:hypothetical protein T484DRAFT_1817205 [Cryptophyta sp. CCMP2293]
MQALNIISSSHVNFPRFSWAHFMALILATSPPIAASLLSAGENCKCGLKFTPLVFSSLGQADNDALRLLYLLDRRTQQTSCDIPSRPILASSDLAPANISFSRLRARLTIAAWVAGAARGSGRDSTFLGTLRSFTSPRVAVRDPASLSPVYLRVRTNPCET